MGSDIKIIKTAWGQSVIYVPNHLAAMHMFERLFSLYNEPKYPPTSDGE